MKTQSVTFTSGSEEARYHFLPVSDDFDDITGEAKLLCTGPRCVLCEVSDIILGVASNSFVEVI